MAMIGEGAMRACCLPAIMIGSNVVQSVSWVDTAVAQTSLNGRHLEFSGYVSCSSTGAVQTNVSSKFLDNVLYVSRTGEAFLFFGASAGFRAPLNKGSRSDVVSVEAYSPTSGRRGLRHYSIPYTATAQFDGKRLSFSFSYDYSGTSPAGNVLSDRYSGTFVFSVSPSSCSWLESRSLRRVADGGSLMENYICGPTVTGSCRVVNDPPAQAK